MPVFKNVEEFNLNVVRYKPKSIENLNLADEFWLVSALIEELQEFMTASELHQKIDALMDLIYYAAGYFTKIGLSHEDSEKIFRHIHECNMKKKKGARGRRSIDTSNDAWKPIDWKGPEEFIKSIIEEAKQRKTRKSRSR